MWGAFAATLASQHNERPIGGVPSELPRTWRTMIGKTRYGTIGLSAGWGFWRTVLPESTGKFAGVVPSYLSALQGNKELLCEL